MPKDLPYHKIAGIEGPLLNVFIIVRGEQAETGSPLFTTLLLLHLQRNRCIQRNLHHLLERCLSLLRSSLFPR